MVNTLLAASLGLSAGCAKITAPATENTNSKYRSTETLLPDPTPLPTGTPTPSPTATETMGPSLSPAEAEMTRVAPLTTPGAVEMSVIQTSEAFLNLGWKEWAIRGFPLSAINSAIGIEVESVTRTKNSGAIINLEGGSGNLMHIDGYWVLLSAGHVLENNMYVPKSIDHILVMRDASLPNSGTVDLFQQDFGVATTVNKNMDFGIVVIPDSVMLHNGGNIFKPEMALKVEQMYFDGNVLDSLYYGICFPWVTNWQPSVFFEARLPKFVSQPSDSHMILNKMIPLPACSGGGQFVKTNNKDLYVGPVVANYGLNPLYVDSAVVTKISALGKSGFLKLIESAKEDYFARNVNQP